MINRKTPCQNCTERHPGCHGECERYKEMKQEREELHKARDDYFEDKRGIHVPYQRKRKKRRYP